MNDFNSWIEYIPLKKILSEISVGKVQTFKHRSSHLSSEEGIKTSFSESCHKVEAQVFSLHLSLLPLVAVFSDVSS